MGEWGVWSYKVMVFEREWDGSFRPTEHYPAQSLATFNTHDLPPFAGWRDGRDLRVKRDIGLDPGEGDDERHRAIAALEAALARAGIPGRDFPAVAEYLGRTGSRMVSISLDDVVGAADQINIPGTVEQHPNWRRRLRTPLESLGEHDQLQRISAALRLRANGR
jgi:4-alpha-glucanotransferase